MGSEPGAAWRDPALGVEHPKDECQDPGTARQQEKGVLVWNITHREVTGWGQMMQFGVQTEMFLIVTGGAGVIEQWEGHLPCTWPPGFDLQCETKASGPNSGGLRCTVLEVNANRK